MNRQNHPKATLEQVLAYKSLTDDQRLEILAKIAAGTSYTEIGAEHNLHIVQVLAIARVFGLTKKGGGTKPRASKLSLTEKKAALLAELAEVEKKIAYQRVRFESQDATTVIIFGVDKNFHASGGMERLLEFIIKNHGVQRRVLTSAFAEILHERLSTQAERDRASGLDELKHATATEHPCDCSSDPHHPQCNSITKKWELGPLGTVVPSRDGK